MYKVILATEKSINIFKDENIVEIARKIINYYSNNISSIYCFDSRIRINCFPNKEAFVKCKASIKDDLYCALSTLLEEEILKG